MQENKIKGSAVRLFILLVSLVASTISHAELNAKSLVESAMQQWRGKSSVAEMKMTVHRPDWERSMAMKSWTSGLNKSLILVTAPAKDKGNANLLKDNQLWTFSPKINRIIKIPSSMMSQSWLGSDLSNRDITKSTEILDQYTFSLIEEGVNDGMPTYTIEAIPLADAPVVWGKEIIVIREDFIMLKQSFFDQDMKLVRQLEALTIDNMSGRPVASHIRVSDLENKNHWTDMIIVSSQFDIQLDDNLFTISQLRNMDSL
jgi:hypothetical protein